MKSVKTSFHGYLFPNINEDGWKFVSVMALISIVFTLLWFPLGCFFFILTILCFYCFRDTPRVTPVLSGAVVSPADGFIVSISKEKGPDALGLQNKTFNRITIYSSLFDQHINRIPLKSKVHRTFYDEGKKYTGKFDKNNMGNERMLIALRHSEGVELLLQQTAVFCNKRIKDKVSLGKEFNAGERFGFIRFGGYTDLFLPDKIEPQVCVGQKMIAGETVMADIKSDAPRIEGEIR